MRALFIALILFSAVAEAESLQINISAESSLYLGAVNLTDDSPAASLNLDWSSDSGLHTGVNCFQSSVEIERAVDAGCNYYAGLFRPVSDSMAFSTQLTHHDYSRGLGGEWDFTDLAVNWHLSKSTVVSAVYSKDWLNRPFDTIAIQAATRVGLLERLDLNISGGLTSLGSSAPIDSLYSAKTSLTFSHFRWTTEAGVIFSDDDQRQVLPFDVDETEVFLTITYRLH